ncbi:MAG: 23S rRNA (guanosine(2251)-2'-O)-methyltransferase RlmB [Acidimicrobiia bacterium]|nr:23S rRNA (guanosine(2251)-2'-O)-methyltransferase RlmB [Acidimicrobiia bacterium]
MANAGFGDRVEGLHAVSEAVRRGRVRRLTVEQKRLRRPEYSELASVVESGGGIVDVEEDVRAGAETEAPQGIVAIADPIPFRNIDDLVTPLAALVVMDHVLDPHNVGAIARSALAAGMTGMVRTHRRSAPLGATALKAAAGALETLPVASVPSAADAVRRLGSEGVWSVALADGAEDVLWDLPLLTEPVALVIGAEGDGVSSLVRERADMVVSIPMEEGIGSLNASVAAALACFEVKRVRARRT